MSNIAASERRERADRRGGDRRQSEQDIEAEDRRCGEDRRLAQRRFEYDRAVDAAKAALVSCGLDSAEFAMAAKQSEQARRRLNEVGGLDSAARR